MPQILLPHVQSRIWFARLLKSRLIWHVLILLAAAAASCPAGAATPSQVLLVINQSSPTSRNVGKAYAVQRQITNVLHVRCIDSAVSQANETIDDADFVSDIENPVRAYLRTHHGIDYIVLTRGIPIRVSGAPTGEAASGQTMASLDGQLAALDYDKVQGAVLITFNDAGQGAVGTAWLNRYWNAKVPFRHNKFGGYLVTRLDGYTMKDAKALTTRALAAEAGLGNGPILLDVEPDFGIATPQSQPTAISGTTITSESAWSTWNGDMEHAGLVLTARNIPVDVDASETFSGNMAGLQGYFSWGSNDDHFSQAAYNSLTFAPGAIGDTAVSTSARSFFPQSTGQSMIADLIAKGITGVKGDTDEPLLQAISSPTIVLERYTHGFPLADSFYAGSHFVGWTDIVIGDPLGAPYAK